MVENQSLKIFNLILAKTDNSFSANRTDDYFTLRSITLKAAAASIHGPVP